MSSPKSVCLITGGLNDHNLRLQPWRYLYEVAYQLAAQGHQVTAITNGASPEESTPSDSRAGAVHIFEPEISSDGNLGPTAHTNGVHPNGVHPNGSALSGKKSDTAAFTLKRITHINQYRWSANTQLTEAVEQLAPDVILWHLGLPSFAHQQIGGWTDRPVIGIYPGLVYGFQDFARIGVKKVAKGYKLSAIHLAGSVLPKSFVRRAVGPGKLQSLVTQTNTTRQKLVSMGVPTESVTTIGPGIDPIWKKRESPSQEMRRGWGFTPDDKVIIYFGSPAPLRGLHTLLQALKSAREQDPTLKLLILNRRHADDLLQEDSLLRSLITDPEIEKSIQLVTGFLEPEVLVQHVAAADIVALPFELVPADAPLSILEAQALGKPVVTTSVASLPELSSAGTRYLAKPADAGSLAAALLQAANGHDSARIENNPSPRMWREVGAEWSAFLQQM